MNVYLLYSFMYLRNQAFRFFVNIFELTMFVSVSGFVLD